MFDRVIVQPGPRSTHSTVSITERRAPTDESVKLLKEFEEAAQRRVTESVKVGNTEFECVIHTMMDAFSQDMISVAYFSLNGNKLRVETRTPSYRASKEEHIRKLIGAISEKIATEIAMPALVALFRS